METSTASPYRYLHKYLDWTPKAGSIDDPLVDMGQKASISRTAKFFGGGRGVFYTIDNGVLQSYKDNTATGGALLTPVRSYGAGWGTYGRTWSSGGGSRIFAVTSEGAVEAFSQSAPTMGDGTVAKGDQPIAATTAFAVALKTADDVWGFNGAFYTLSDEKVTRWNYSEKATANGFIPQVGSPTVIASGLTGATQAWMPGPDTLYANAADTVKSYTGSPLALADSKVQAALPATDILPDAYTCLSDQTVDKPLGDLPQDPVPLATMEPAPTPTAPSGPTKVSGTFTLGNGQPAAGITVRVEAADPALMKAEGSATDLPDLGTTKTAGDGSWSLTLPAQLPAAVQAAADANGGIVQVSASAAGQTTSGVHMFGVDMMSAAASESVKTSSIAATFPAPRKVALLPEGRQEAAPTQAGMDNSSPAQVESDAASGDSVPEWQSDSGPEPTNFNPYLVDGVDVRSQQVSDYAGSASGECEWVTTNLGSEARYTTVGEAHANWDAYASFEYETKVSSVIDWAVKANGNWTLGGSWTLNGPASSSSGYANRGPYFAKAWRIPILYLKQRRTWYCGGIPRGSHERIVPSRFWIPAGGAPGIFGHDVSHLDGAAAYDRSNPAFRGYVVPGSFFQQAVGRSYKQSIAATAFNVSLGAYTQYDQDHKQRITTGTKNGRHDIWGFKARPGQPGTLVFYSW
ncbi:hypothetical protein [Streptomyces sp. NPDC086023]|uniref:hypothetical protein n=1 Tax=Streptomyces sp. NPDC086023 TaxID=3365746 RepID=UPI0037D8277C